MIRRFLILGRRLIIVLAVAGMLKLIWALWSFDWQESPLPGPPAHDLLARRRYLLDAVVTPPGTVLRGPRYLDRQFQGEWALGTMSMLSAALVNIAFLSPETREESLTAVQLLIEHVLSDPMREFDRVRWGEDPLESLGGENGHIGYLGHLNWMLGAFRFLGGDGRHDEKFRQISETLARRLRANAGLCLKTYPFENVYLPDNVVVIASLANFARLNGGRFRDIADAWVLDARSRLFTNELGLLPFHLTGACLPASAPRGSGAGWSSYYLPFIDRDLADDQFRKIKEHLVQTRLVTGVREFPRGVWGLGDVDSGPVLLGFSPSGTGFAVGGAMHAKDFDLARKLLFSAELAGSTREWNGRRTYVFSPLVGDAIMLAMKTAVVWDDRFVRPDRNHIATPLAGKE